MIYKCVQLGTLLLSIIFTLFLSVFVGDFCSFGSTISLRRHGPIFFSSSSISCYINGQYTPRPSISRMARWTRKPSRRHRPTSLQTRFSPGGLLSFTGTDTSQRTWSCPIQCSIQCKLQKRQCWRTWSSFHLGTSLSTWRGGHFSF